MKFRTVFIFLGVAASLIVSSVSLAEIYKWKDSEGTTHFTDGKDKIPLQYRKNVERPYKFESKKGDVGDKAFVEDKVRVGGEAGENKFKGIEARLTFKVMTLTTASTYYGKSSVENINKFKRRLTWKVELKNRNKRYAVVGFQVSFYDSLGNIIGQQNKLVYRIPPKGKKIPTDYIWVKKSVAGDIHRGTIRIFSSQAMNHASSPLKHTVRPGVEEGALEFINTASEPVSFSGTLVYLDNEGFALKKYAFPNSVLGPGKRYRIKLQELAKTLSLKSWSDIGVTFTTYELEDSSGVRHF